MRFELIDGVESFEAGKKLVAWKGLTLGEEYLADHFPAYPVMPGVLMLEALSQSAAWLIRVSTGFVYPVAVLREVKGVKYGTFVEPGNRLRLVVEVSSPSPDGESCWAFKGTGFVDKQVAVAGRLKLAAYKLADRMVEGDKYDRDLVEYLRRKWTWLTSGRLTSRVDPALREPV